MKKILLALAILFTTVTSSFAYQQVIYCNPMVGYAGTTVTINATCSYVKFDCSWYDFIGSYSSGSAVAYSDVLIGEYTWWTGNNSPSYSSGVFSSRYWGSVQMTMSASSCYGQASLEWMP